MPAWVSRGGRATLPTMPGAERERQCLFGSCQTNVTVPGTRRGSPSHRPHIGSAPMGPIIVEVRRNGIVEARHVVHAVAVQSGAVVAEAGDAALTCFMRSSSKPIQALPLPRARAHLDDPDLAIASASHPATHDQIPAVPALLAQAPPT